MRVLTPPKARDQKLDRTLGRHAGLVNAVAFSSDGARAISGGGDGTVRVWDVANGRQAHAFNLPKGVNPEVKDVTFSRDDRLAIAFLYDGVPPLAWDVATGQPVRGPLNAGDLIPSPYSSGYRYGVRGLTPFLERDENCRCWVIVVLDRGGQTVGRFQGHQGYVRGMPVLTDDGWYMVSGGADRTVRVWDVKLLTPVHTLQGHHGDVLCVAFSPGKGGFHALSGAMDGEVRLWESVC